MKEPNVLEAKNLCVNGNPVEMPVFSDSEVYRIICLFQPTSREFLGLSRAINKLASLWKDIELMPKPNYEKGTHASPPRGISAAGQKSIIMPNGADFYGGGLVDSKPKGILNVAFNPVDKDHRIKEKFLEGKSPIITDQPITFRELKDDYYRKKAEINAKYDREQVVIQRKQCIDDLKKAKKAIPKESWLTKFKKWLKYWFTPVEPSLKFSDLYNDDYYKRKAKVAESDQAKYSERTNTIDDEIRKVFSDYPWPSIKENPKKNKYLQQLRRRRKKRYSISTPITRK